MALPLPEIEVNAKRPSLSGDGLTLFYCVGELDKGELAGDASLHARSGSTARSVNELNSPSRDAGPFLLADGLTIVFQSDRLGNFGGGFWIGRRA